MIVPTLIALPLFVVSSGLAEEHSEWNKPSLAEGDDDTATRSGSSSDASSKGGGQGVHDRNAMMEANFRGRFLSLPDSIMDVWFFDEDDEGAAPYPRPQVRAYSVGIEYVLKPRPVNWIFYYEYIGSMMAEGYWDDVEEPAQHEDGDWVRPNGFGIHGVGANYAHEVDLTNNKANVWLSMLFGGGMGVGIVTGSLDQWHPGSNSSVVDTDCLSNSAAYLRYESCANDGAKRIPNVLPIIDLTASTRLNFADRATIRFDFGLHDMIYYGFAAGGVF